METLDLNPSTQSNAVESGDYLGENERSGYGSCTSCSCRGYIPNDPKMTSAVCVAITIETTDRVL